MEKKANIDYGHYVDCHIGEGPLTLKVGDGETVYRTFLLGKDNPPFDGIIVGKGASVSICYIIPPEEDVTLPITVDLDGDGADVKLFGVFLCDREQKVSISTDVRHHSPSCNSLQVFNGIASGKAKAVFSGKIVVAPDAQKTEAYQTNRNILLSGEATVDTTPTLEIYADDVKCSHGATVGALSEEEQFYMRSRGISEKEAKTLQLISFVSPVVDSIPDEGQREEVRTMIEKQIRGMME